MVWRKMAKCYRSYFKNILKMLEYILEMRPLCAPTKTYLETIRRTKKITKQIVRALNITGPFNLQF